MKNQHFQSQENKESDISIAIDFQQHGLVDYVKQFLVIDDFMYLLVMAVQLLEYWGFLFVQTTILLILLIFFGLIIQLKSVHQDLKHLVSSADYCECESFLRWRTEFKKVIGSISLWNDSMNLYIGFTVVVYGFGVLAVFYVATIHCNDLKSEIEPILKFVLMVFLLVCPAIVLHNQVGTCVLGGFGCTSRSSTRHRGPFLGVTLERMLQHLPPWVYKICLGCNQTRLSLVFYTLHFLSNDCCVNLQQIIHFSRRTKLAAL